MNDRTAVLVPGIGSYVPGSLARYRHVPVVVRTLSAVDRAALTWGEQIPAPSELLLDAEAPAAHDLAGAHQAAHQLAVYAQGVAYCALLCNAYRRLVHTVVGHSIGEVSALAATGVISRFDGAILLIAGERARAAHGVGPGGLLTLRLPAWRVRDLIVEAGTADIEVACVNSPTQTVVSGPARAVDDFAVRARRASVTVHRLATTTLFHHARLSPVAGDVRRIAAEVRFHEPVRPVYSPTLDRAYDGAAEYREAVVNHLVRPVPFTAAITRLQRAGTGEFLEAGPRPGLGHLVRATAPTASVHTPLAQDPNAPPKTRPEAERPRCQPSEPDRRRAPSQSYRRAADTGRFS
ncbi:acyltransferase domain-containing protein [Catenulispora sp. NL8]|uniref:[acyl-carrier-protein] S-malonyltransferase n=1 Tax=Catenulispora pinistramenti TaxID=2705254 RepID=A0ABS5KVP4_9ACTN|nr:acyltransferase domain-containing protein [Catenulispora pinistramenti]MBS2550064.1 acyltransferase domain-containing protein [Catenulispora pinistramenti]